MNNKKCHLNGIGLKLIFFFILVFFFGIALPSLGLATSYYVAPNGNNSNPGTESQPWLTVSFGIGHIHAGDTLYIRGGTYKEQVCETNSGTAGAPITIAAYPGETPVIDGNNWTIPSGDWSVLFEVLGDYVNVTGIEVRYSNWIGFDISGQHCVVSKVYSHHNKEHGLIMYGDYGIVEDSVFCNNCQSNVNGSRTRGDWAGGLSAIPHPSYVTLQRNTIYMNWGEGINIGGDHITVEDNVVYDNYSGQMYPSNATDILIQRNLIYHSDNSAMNVGGRAGILIGDEAAAPVSNNITIINNLFYGNYENFHWWFYLTGGMHDYTIANNTMLNARGLANIYIGSADSDHVGTVFENNIIVQDDLTPLISFYAPRGGLTFSRNLWNTPPPSYAVGAGDVVSNPQDAKTGSTLAGKLSADYFKILSSSPAIDHAAVLTDVTEDFIGTPRGTAPDIGAFEYTNGTSPLTALATGSPTAGQDPLAVNFGGSASGGASPYSYGWTFDDGGSSTIQNPSHTYSSAGTYTATLIITDSTSATANSTVSISVAASVALSANFGASPTSGQTPLVVNFTGSASGGSSPYSYRWTFGDGGSSTTQNPSHTYSSAGSYTATLTATDSASATASSAVNITVTAAVPLSAGNVASPPSGQAPLSVNFAGKASGGTPPYTYRWAFGDSGSSTTQNPSHTYSSAGSYTATLTVTDNASATASSTANITVTAAAPLSATIVASATSGQAPLTVNFTGSANGGTSPYSYAWTFGDGGSTTSQNPSHTYSSAGRYTTTLAVSDSSSVNASATVSIAVSIASKNIKYSLHQIIQRRKKSQ
jgi:PKD repeat protein